LVDPAVHARSTLGIDFRTPQYGRAQAGRADTDGGGPQADGVDPQQLSPD